MAHASTLEDGRFYIAVRKDSQIAIAVSHEAGGGQIRDVDLKSADTTVPPTTGDPNCVDVGTWTIRRGVVVLADGSTFSCDGQDIESAFANSCAAGFGGIFMRWMPEGDCTFSGLNLVYDNGAVLENTSTCSSRFVSPSGELCGTSTTNFNISTGDGTITYTNQSNENYVILIGSDTSDLTIQCPNGETFTLTAKEQQALQACTGAGGMESVCGGTPDINLPGTCTNDSECLDTFGLESVCCDIAGVKTCTLKNVCDRL